MAAVALPQYTKTVERSRIAQAFTMGKAVFDSVQRYNMEFGEFPTKFEQLDIDPGLTDVGTNSASLIYEVGTINKYFTVYLRKDGALVDRAHLLEDGTVDLSHRYVIFFCAQDGSAWCGASHRTQSASQKESDHSLCKSLGGVVGTPPTGCTGSRDVFYRLQ